MATKSVAIHNYEDGLARELAVIYDGWKQNRAEIESEWSATQRMVFATDAMQSVGVAASSTWKNVQTRGKITQVRDNLHANYMAALFPNRKWLTWQPSVVNDQTARAKSVISQYMMNKIELSNFYKTINQLVLDYVDYGVCFAAADYAMELRQVKDPVQEGVKHAVYAYRGPVARRWSPHDVVIDPTASSISDTNVFTRELMSFGEMMSLAQDKPLNDEYTSAVKRMEEIRKLASGKDTAEIFKDRNYIGMGFGSYTDYLRSGVVEIMTFYGTLFSNGEVHRNRKIVIADRCIILSNEEASPLPGGGYILMASWRDRPDNLYGQSPLAKLLGLQFRLDKLENTKADAHDLAVNPPLHIVGNLDDFDWCPGAQITGDPDSKIEEMGKNLQAVLTAQNEIGMIEQAMEEYAGAPKQSMGFRTPGEKTRYEVQSLETAGNRIFQQKSLKFERELLEPLLNNMLDVARSNITEDEMISVVDDDYKFDDFVTVSKDDLLNKGLIRAIGARHFVDQAAMIQELTQLTTSGMWPVISQHFSGKRLAKLIEDSLDLTHIEGLVIPFVGLSEQMEGQQLAAKMQENAAMAQGEDPTLTESDVATTMGGLGG
jgi:hypothetical protein